jgi:heme/copper-type cytochrome/quinol oxidase subunit 3
MRPSRALRRQTRRLAVAALLVPAAFGIAFLVLELGSIAAARAA